MSQSQSSIIVIFSIEVRFFSLIFFFSIFGFLGLCLGLDFLFKIWFVLPLLGFRFFFFFFFWLLGFWVCFIIGFLGFFFRYFCSSVIDFLFLFFRDFASRNARRQCFL